MNEPKWIKNLREIKGLPSGVGIDDNLREIKGLLELIAVAVCVIASLVAVIALKQWGWL